MNPIDLAERGVLPDWLVRRGMRRLLARRLEEQRQRKAAREGGAGQTALLGSRRTKRGTERIPTLYTLPHGSELRFCLLRVDLFRPNPPTRQGRCRQQRFRQPVFR
jgi:hypothetical protein